MTSPPPPLPPFASLPFPRHCAQLACAYIIFISAYVVAHEAPEEEDGGVEGGPEGGGAASPGKDEEGIGGEGDRAARAEASKLFLARYGGLIEDYKVRAGGPSL